ncbi:CLUMA_CG014557, isoform A [Clunio marinus]|uniref:CLUMA_CG014557, isoform A n=1 Tax=Clunio marinus TaxID=568069 RepID=A0A1J1ILP6_9DIPT|nr:CLUMA_CG014557, isoform A [Clunio marinus]
MKKTLFPSEHASKTKLPHKALNSFQHHREYVDSNPTKQFLLYEKLARKKEKRQAVYEFPSALKQRRQHDSQELQYFENIYIADWKCFTRYLTRGGLRPELFKSLLLNYKKNKPSCLHSL